MRIHAKLKGRAIGNYEGLCEAVELIIRYSQATAKGRVASTQGIDALADFATSDYLADVLRLLQLAATWMDLETLWDEVRYSHWRLSENPSGDSFIIGPENLSDVADRHAARLRESKFYVDVALPGILVSAPEHGRLIDRAAVTVTLPSFFEVWDGYIDVELLRLATSYSPFLILADEIISAKHYSPILNKIRIGTGITSGTWQDWLNIVNTVQDISRVLKTASINSGKLLVFRVRLDKLARLSSSITDIDVNVCMAILQNMVFDRKRQGLDIFDQPLLEIGNGECLLVPAFIENSHPRGMIEDYVRQFSGKDQLGGRDTTYEKHVAQVMSQAKDAKVVHDVQFDAPDGKRVQFDVIVWWDSYLILIEAKCLKTVYDAADDETARKDLDIAIEQLQRRRSLIADSWDLITHHAPSLCLPENPPENEKILCVAVTNTLRFTPSEIDGIVITDDLTLNRFFGDPAVVGFAMKDGELQEAKTLGMVRDSDVESPELLMRYLRDPLQYSSIRKNVTAAIHYLYQEPGEVQIGFPVGQYSGDSISIKESLLAPME